MKLHRTIVSDEEARKRIDASAYLTLIYREIYETFFRETGRNKDLRVLEIGAGSTSFGEKFWPTIQKTSYSNQGGTKAEDLKFEPNSFDLILAKDVLHHIKDIPRAFRVFEEILVPGGKVLASEPSWSLLGRFVYRFLHEEEWRVESHFKFEETDAWESNQALILNLLRLDDSKRLDILSNLKITVLGSTYGISYLLSGGVYSPTRIPSKFLLFIHKKFGGLRKKYQQLFSLNRIVSFEKSIDA
jgi:SAM-dependent methyltransferase